MNIEGLPFEVDRISGKGAVIYNLVNTPRNEIKDIPIENRTIFTEVNNLDSTFPTLNISLVSEWVNPIYGIKGEVLNNYSESLIDTLKDILGNSIVVLGRLMDLMGIYSIAEYCDFESEVMIGELATKQNHAYINDLDMVIKRHIKTASLALALDNFGDIDKTKFTYWIRSEGNEYTGFIRLRNLSNPSECLDYTCNVLELPLFNTFVEEHNTYEKILEEIYKIYLENEGNIWGN